VCVCMCVSVCVHDVLNSFIVREYKEREAQIDQHTEQGWPELYIYGVYTVFLAGLFC
jgi:hypothetical protein